MGDDLSLFDRRMRKPAAISVTAGVILGFLSVQAQQFNTTINNPIALALIYATLATVALYAVTYRNLSRRLERES